MGLVRVGLQEGYPRRRRRELGVSYSGVDDGVEPPPVPGADAAGVAHGRVQRAVKRDGDGMRGRGRVAVARGGGDGVFPPSQSHEREVGLFRRSQRLRSLDVERPQRHRGEPVLLGQRERAEVRLVVVLTHALHAVLERGAHVGRGVVR